MEIDYANFQWEQKLCPVCKIVKPKVINFSLKSRMCRECSHKKYIENRVETPQDLKLSWKSRGFSL